MAETYARLLRASSFAATPWKNGGGTTREIAIHPNGASLEKSDFLWRLSQAEVREPGPFSVFPGFERILTLTAGKELVLKSEAELVALPKGKVLQFSGADPHTVELPHGPVSDCGIIFRPEKVKVDCKVLDFQKRPRSFKLAFATNFFVVAEGEFSAETYPGELQFPLSPGDVLRVDPVAPGDSAERLVLLQPTAKGGRIIAVEIIPPAQPGDPVS